LPARLVQHQQHRAEALRRWKIEHGTTTRANAAAAAADLDMQNGHGSDLLLRDTSGGTELLHPVKASSRGHQPSTAAMKKGVGPHLPHPTDVVTGHNVTEQHLTAARSAAVRGVGEPADGLLFELELH